MAKLLKLRRGTTSQHSSFTGAEGEVTVDTDKESLVVHNGSTAGGFPIARADGTGVTNFTISGELDAATLDISGNADIDGTLEAEAITVNGTALDTHIAGVTVTNATNAAHVSVADNENTNENNLITFIEDASATGNVGLESDGDFHYNPSTGKVTATTFAGNLTGNVTGNASGSAATVTGAAQSAITSVGTLTGLTIAGNVTFDNSDEAGKDITWVEDQDHLVFADDVYAKFGGGGDMALYHNGTTSYISNSTGDLYIQTAGSGDDVVIQAVDDIFIKPQGGENGIEVLGDGAVKLFHDNEKRLETTSTGITVQGGEGASGVIGLYADEGDDNADKFQWLVDTSGVMKWQAYSGGSWQDELTLSNAGDLVATGNVTAYSDARLKTDVDTIENALDKVTKLRGVSYTKVDTDQRGIGVIAQEIEEVLPEVVQDGAYKSVAYGNIVGVLIEAIKELKAELDEHKKASCGGE